MCERCGNDDCNGNRVMRVGYNIVTGEFEEMEDIGNYTNAYDQSRASIENVLCITMKWWRETKSDRKAADFEAMMNLIAHLQDSFPRAVITNMLAVCLIMLEEREAWHEPIL